MKFRFTSILLNLLLLCAISSAQVSITATGAAFTEDFSILASALANTSSTMPAGWSFLETGTNANSTYLVDNGGSFSGNTLSYGSTGTPDRALGVLLSGSLTSTFGASFTNSSGAIITSLLISFTGEQWRLGTASRADRIDFQYSVNATALNTGTYTDVDNLDFTSPTTVLPLGALDGNAAANRTSVSFTITGLNINAGSIFWIRWNDLNASGADDGLAVDDFSITANGTPVSPCATPLAQATNLGFSAITTTSIAGSFTAATGADKYLVVRSTSNTLSATPVNGSSYTVGSSLGGGTVVSANASTSFTTSGLTQGTTFYFYVFSYNDLACSGGANYLTTSPLLGSQATAVPAACTTPNVPTTLILTPAVTSITGNFTASGANKYLVVQASSTPFTGAINNGTIYPVNSNIGDGKVVSYNSTNTFTATGLVANTTYYFFVFSANDACLGEPFYSATSLPGSATTTTNNIPVGYYNAAQGLSCAPLKTALSSIITNGHTQNNYGGLDDVQMVTTDDRLNDAGIATIVYDMYSDNPTGVDPYTYTFSQFNIGTGTDGEGNGWNKEHSFPNSWFSASSSTNNFPGADLYHLFPTDMDVNSLRGNFPFGEVATATTTTANGGKLGSSAITYAGYSGPVFEPINAYKGDFARATLYMVTRYQSEQPSWENLQPTGDVVMDGTIWPSIEIDYLRMLIQWHNDDPVSTKELERNNEVFGYQNNRNPFVDHPEYVGQIWSTSCGLALPITFTSFGAQLVSKKVVLNWRAENPQGFSHFLVERSTDGLTFISIGQLAPSNTTVYNFADDFLPLSTNAYYRLKLVDDDGSFKYSKIINVKLRVDFCRALIYPNPVSQKLQMNFYEPLFSHSTLQITNSVGSVILTQALGLGNTQHTVNVSAFPAGKYFIKIANSRQIIRETFIIAR